MTEELRKMAAETMAALEERNALPQKANHFAIRFAADYIVKKSPFAPYFRALGITDGTHIGRAFEDARRDTRSEKARAKKARSGVEDFFVTVVRLQHLYAIGQDFIPSYWVSAADMLKNHTWDAVELDVRAYWTKLLRSFVERRNMSIGGGAAAEAYSISVRQEMHRLISFLLADGASAATVIDEAVRLGISYDAIVLTAHIAGINESEAYLNWLSERFDDVIDTFIQHGTSRAELSKCHGIPVCDTTRDSVQSIQATKIDRSSIGGIVSHRELNKRATAFQDKMDRAWHLLQDLPLLDPETLKHYDI